LKRDWRVVALFAFAITVWGLNYPFVKEGVSLSSPLWFAVLRVFSGLIVSVALLFAMKTKGKLTPRQTAAAFLLGIPGSALFFGFWALAATQIPAGLVSVFIYTYPLWTLFLSIPILKDPPSTRRLGAAFLGFFGVALTSQLGFVSVPASELGAIAELVAAGLGFAIMNVYFKKLFKGEQLIRANVWQLAGAFVVLAVWAGVTTPVQGIQWNLDLLLVLIWVGAIGTAVVYVVFFTLMSKYSAASLTAYFFLVVVVALVSSYFISGETIDVLQAVGVGAIIVAIYLVGQSDRSKRKESLSPK
jgi:drug/metabolite transporter (DMT)-like permease